MQRNATRATLVIVSVAAIWAAIATPAVAQFFPGAGIVMTYNVNEGTDFDQVVGAQTLPQFLLGVGQILTQVQGTNPPERMQAVAGKILEVQPELLSLLVCLNRRCLTTREGGLPRFPEADLNEAALRQTLSRARCQQCG